MRGRLARRINSQRFLQSLRYDEHIALSQSGTAAGQPAHSLSLPNLDCTEVSPEAMRGRIVID
jgi:hypothetical protein